MTAPPASRRLLTAIIRRAVLDFALYKECSPATHPERHALAVDAAGWLFFRGLDTVDAEGRYTFGHICRILGLDANAIRARVLELTEDDLKRFSAGGD